MERVKIWHPDKTVVLTDQIGEGTVIHAFAWIGRNVIIGDSCRIQAHAFIPDGVYIGDFVFIGPGVTFTNDKHPPSDQWDAIVVNNFVSIGARSVLLPGVAIGEGAVIGAGSVVTKDVPARETWYGNPARRARENNH